MRRVTIKQMGKAWKEENIRNFNLKKLEKELKESSGIEQIKIMNKIIVIRKEENKIKKIIAQNKREPCIIIN